MKEVLIITNVLAALMTIVALIFIIRGLVILIVGKCRVRGTKFKGGQARTIGFVFLIAPVIAFAVYAMLYESYKWGGSGYSADEQVMKNIASSSVQTILLLFGVLVAYLYGQSQAKVPDKEEEHKEEPVESAP
jgi:uncharacterized membrane protein